MVKIIKRNSYKVLAGVLMVSMFGFYFSLIDRTNAAQVSNRSDTLSNSDFSATSNHTITFTVQDSIDRTCSDCSASDTVTITMGAAYVMGGIDCGDIDVSTGTQFLLNVAGGSETRTDCRNTATSWGIVISGQVITLTSPSTVMTFVATGTAITIAIGSNATSQNTGNEWITNPAGATPPTSPPQYPTVVIGGTFGGTGTIMTAILQGVEVSATVAETLTIALAGLPGHSGVAGGVLMSVCGNNTVNPSGDDEDLETVTFVTTTATTVPFGTVNTGIIYQGCQKLSITTNAANGFTVRTRENNPLRTPGGVEIANANCDSNACLNTPSTSGAFTLSGGGTGFGISCSNATTSSVTCSTSEPAFGCTGSGCAGTISGTSFAPIAYEGQVVQGVSAPQSPARIASWSTATGIEIINKIKYRLRIPGSQGAGVYTNIVSFIVTSLF